MEIDTEAVSSDSKLYLYGVDNMSTRDISEQYLCGRFPDITFSWINDSSCVLAFENADDAAEAFHAYTVKTQNKE